MSETPQIPALPGRAFDLEPGRRETLAAAFSAGGDHYDAVRPDYPEAIVDFMVPAGARVAADVGAGTGIFTRHLIERGLETWAIDPSADMLGVLARNLPAARVLEGSAEATGLPPASVDVVSVAQAWHWVDPVAASAEAARILRPGGRIALVWNQLDVAVPWVHRLTRIMHAGDVHRPGFAPPLGLAFGTPVSHEVRWIQPANTDAVLELTKSRSYYLRASEATRAKVEANLDWYLHEHLGHARGAALELPYLTHAWIADLR